MTVDLYPGVCCLQEWFFKHALSIDVNRKCLAFKKYCKYDIFQQKMLRKVEIGRLHKWIVEMWII